MPSGTRCDVERSGRRRGAADLDIEHTFELYYAPMTLPSAFTELRERFDQRFRDTSQAAFTLADEAVLRTGMLEFDRILGGGLPRGTIATLEGAPSSGRLAIAARLLAVATSAGLGAVVGTPTFPPALSAAGVRLERLLIVSTSEPVGAARAADILLRSGAFSVVVIPALPSGRGTGSATWTRLASLAHRANAVLIAVGFRSIERTAVLRLGAARNGNRAGALERAARTLRNPRRLRRARDGAQAQTRRAGRQRAHHLHDIRGSRSARCAARTPACDSIRAGTHARVDRRITTRRAKARRVIAAAKTQGSSGFVLGEEPRGEVCFSK